MALLGPETDAGTSGAFLERERCSNASDYIYVTNALVQNEPIDGDFDEGDTLENAIRRLKMLSVALVEQVPTDQTADAQDMERLADLFISSYEPADFRPNARLREKTSARAAAFQPSGERFYTAQVEDCSSEVPDFGKGLLPPS